MLHNELSPPGVEVLATGMIELKPTRTRIELLATTRHFCRRQKFGPKIPRCLFAPKDRIVDDQNQLLTFAAEWCIAFAKARMVADPNDFLMPPRCESGAKLLANKLNYYRQGSRIITG